MPSRTAFKNGIAAILGTHNNLHEPDEETAKLWAEILKEIPDEIFMAACKQICKMTRSPQNIPGEIIQIAENAMGKLTAEQAYQIIEEQFNAFYDPALGSSAWVAIQSRLKSRGYENLIPLASRWGQEIWIGSNPVATRAQFLKSYESQIKLDERKRLSGSGEFKKLQIPNDNESQTDSRDIQKKSL